MVTNVIDGHTFDVRIEKGDSRIKSSVERISLADVRSPDMKTIQGPAARDFTYAVLMDRRIYLDIDNHVKDGRDSEGRLISVVYLSGMYGQPILYPNFNLLLVDASHAMLINQTDNEFDPKNWKEEYNSYNSYNSGNTDSDPLQRMEENLRERLKESLPGSGEELQKRPKEGLQNGSQNNLLTRIEDVAGEKLDQAKQAAWDWLKTEITNASQELVNSSLDHAFNHS